MTFSNYKNSRCRIEIRISYTIMTFQNFDKWTKDAQVDTLLELLLKVPKLLLFRDTYFQMLSKINESNISYVILLVKLYGLT